MEYKGGMSEKPQIEHKGNESTETDVLVAGKLMETKRICNRRGWPLKLCMFLLLVVLWLCHDQINTWLHDHKEVAYKYDECISVAHCYIRKGWVIVLYAIVWFITIIDEIRYRKWFLSVTLSCIGIIYYYAILTPCGAIIGDVFILLSLGSIATLVLSLYKKKNIFSNQNELLGRGKVYNEILNHLLEAGCRYDRGTSMAIIGNWGTGKSHCIQYLKHKLTQKYKGKVYRVCEVDLWQISNLNEGFAAVASELEFALTGRDKPNNNSLAHLLKIGLYGIIANTGVGDSYFQQVIDYIGDEGNANKGLYAEKFGKKIKQECGDGGIVLIMDNVERANDDVLQNMLPLVDKLKEIRQLTIVCAIDAKAIQSRKIFRENRINADGYLSKLFDTQYTLPDIGEQGVVRMQDTVLKKYEKSNRVRRFLWENKILFETPRQIERVLMHLCYIDKSYIEEKERNKQELFIKDDSNNLTTEETRKYFSLQWSDRDYSSRNVFLVAILQLLYKDICDEILMAGNINRFLENFDPILYKHSHRNDASYISGSIRASNGDENRGEQWNKMHPISAKIIKSDCLAWSIMCCLKDVSINSFDYCFENRYERIVSLKICDAREIIETALKENLNTSASINRQLLAKFPDNIEDSKKFIISYASHYFNADNEYLIFLKNYFEIIYNIADDITLEKISIQRYICSDVFLIPFIVNLCRENISQSSMQIVDSLFNLIIGGMDIVKLSKCIRVFYYPLRNRNTVLQVIYNSFVDTINVESDTSSSIYKSFTDKLAKAYMKLMIEQFDSHDSVALFENESNYSYYDAIDYIDEVLVQSSSKLITRTDYQTYYRRMRALLSYISHVKNTNFDRQIYDQAPYITKNQYSLFKILMMDIVKYERVTNCNCNQLHDLFRVCDARLRNLSNCYDHIRLTGLADKHTPLFESIEILRKAHEYLTNTYSFRCPVKK